MIVNDKTVPNSFDERREFKLFLLDFFLLHKPQVHNNFKKKNLNKLVSEQEN